MSAATKNACALLCLAAALTAPVARADVAPPDVTCDTKDSACDNASPNGFGMGVCTTGVPVTSHGRPSCGEAGAAAGAAATECLFCKAAGGASNGGASNGGNGTAGTSNAAGGTAAGASNAAGGTAAGASNAAGGTAAGASSTAGTLSIGTAGTTAAGSPSTASGGAQTSSGGNSDSGCSVRQLGSERGIAIFMLGLGLAALSLGRRRH